MTKHNITRYEMLLNLFICFEYAYLILNALIEVWLLLVIDGGSVFELNVLHFEFMCFVYLWVLNLNSFMCKI